jgi:hypothetical protein
LRAADIALVLNHGVRRPIEVGEYLFRQGDQSYEFYVVLSGAVEVIVHDADGTDRVLTRHGPGRFVGELNLVTGLRLFVSGRVVESGEVVVVVVVLTDLELDDAHLDGGWVAAGRRPLPFETSRPGLFAVGDLRSGSMKRVASAVGEGSAAVRSVHQYLAFDSH